MIRDREEWAEEHGYVAYRCPKCKKRFHDDAGPDCPYCGWTSAKEEESDDGE